jgi:uncharacterized protein
MPSPNRLPPFANRLASAWLVLTALVCLGAAIPPAAAQQSPGIEDLSRFPQSALTIQTRHGPHEFRVWEADTPSRKSQGLMFVRSLANDRGMLFVNEAPRRASMWMKNTYISLDMLFIDSKGRVAEIRASTTPHSLEIIESAKPVLAVLELAAGEAAKRGIQPGDRVLHAAFGTRQVRGTNTTKKP